jgi:hypothetical protein
MRTIVRRRERHRDADGRGSDAAGSQSQGQEAVQRGLAELDRSGGQDHQVERRPHACCLQRGNAFGHQVWETYEAILEACCNAWNTITNRPDLIRSIGKREWAEVIS